MKISNLTMKGPLVLASLDGRKTQTRRLRGLEKVNVEPGRFEPVMPPQRIKMPSSKHKHHNAVYLVFRRDDGRLVTATCQWGGPGDLIYVREAWRTETKDWDPLSPSQMDWDDPDTRARILYEADGNWADNHTVGRLRAAMHMPRRASRLTLRITGVRVERLQDISGPDCCAEGVQFRGLGHGPSLERGNLYRDNKAGFRKLWESLNGPGSWARNPWVWVLEYEAIAANVDADWENEPAICANCIQCKRASELVCPHCGHKGAA